MVEFTAMIVVACSCFLLVQLGFIITFVFAPRAMAFSDKVEGRLLLLLSSTMRRDFVAG